MSHWALYVRSKSLTRVAEIDKYHRFETILRWNDASTWQLEMPGDNEAARELMDEEGVMLFHEGRLILSGPKREQVLKRGNTGPVLEVSGIDDTGMLMERIAFTDPSGPPFTTQAEDIQNGPVEDVLRHYVNVNAGPGSLAPLRPIPGLILGTYQGGIGPIIGGAARFENLLELLQHLAEVVYANQTFRFRIEHTGPGVREFIVSELRDRSDTAVFSTALGNLKQVEQVESWPRTNYVVIGGAGEGQARTFATQQDLTSQTQYGRFESFIDSRSTTDSARLNQDGDAELAKGKEFVAAELEIIETEHAVFLEDYELGDLVTLVIEGQAQSAIIQEVEITLNKDGETVRPRVATTPQAARSLSSGGGLNVALRDTDRRVSNLERRAESFTNGMLLYWTGNISGIPSGWQLANGTNGAPNVLGRFVLGAGGSYALGATGGAETVDIRHRHGGQVSSDASNTTSVTDDGSNQSTVADDSHRHNIDYDLSSPTPIMPPYVALYPIWRSV